VSPQLQVIQFDGCWATKEAHRHAHLPLIRQYLFNGATEVGERPLGDLYHLSNEERDLFLGLRLGNRFGDAEQAVHLVLPEGLRHLPRAHELDHTLDAVHHVQGFLAHRHLDQHVPGVELALDVDLLAVLDLDHILDRDQGLPNQLGLGRTWIFLDPPLQQSADLVLVPGSCLNRVPAVFHQSVVSRESSVGSHDS
jgi:hypothetical protein